MIDLEKLVTAVFGVLFLAALFVALELRQQNTKLEQRLSSWEASAFAVADASVMACPKMEGFGLVCCWIQEEDKP